MQQAEQAKQKPTRMILEQAETVLPEEFDAVLINYLGNKCEAVGKLVLTDFRCLFITTKQTIYHDNEIKFDFSLGYIARCESSSESINKTMVFYIEITSKLGLGFKLKSQSPNLVRASEHINQILTAQQLIFGERRTDALDDHEFCKKWEHFSMDCDLENEDAVDYDNLNWSPLPLYPPSFKVPKPFIGKRNPVERLILLSFVLEVKKRVGLWRNGPGKPDADQEKWIPAAVRKGDHTVVEIKTRSLGSSKSIASEFFQLDGAPQLRESFSKMLYSSCYMSQQLENQQKWLTHMNSSRWFEQIEILFYEAHSIHEKLSEGENVTIISDWDVRGAQISSLVQIIAKPENRTINGLAHLVEREFLHYGNWFNPASKKEKNEDKGIALIQFFDCVHQLVKMYPLSFEFNEDFLTYLAIHVYSRKYGNFLYATRVTDDAQRLRSLKFGCVWQRVNRNKSAFLNAFYVDHKECDLYELKRPLTMKSIQLWSSFFLRDLFMYGNTLEINSLREHHRIVHQRHQAAKMHTEELRRKISDQHKLILEKKNKIKELEQNQLD